MNKIYFSLFCFFIVPFAFGQAVSVNASIDKSTIVIGEQAKLTLRTSFSKGIKPSFFAVDSFLHFEILNSSKIDTQAVGDKIQLEQVLTITSWDSGSWQIPAFGLAVARGVHTKPLPVEVGFSKPFDPNQPYHEVKDILDASNKIRETWYWYLAGALLLLLLFLLIFPKSKKKEKEEVKVDTNAYKKALAKIDQLKKEGPADSKVYYTELINIFRTYLQQRKGIHSFQKTTDDLSRQIAQLKLKDEELNTLTQTLQLSDFVKFAKYEPTSAEKESSAETIKKSIIAIEGLV